MSKEVRPFLVDRRIDKQIDRWIDRQLSPPPSSLSSLSFLSLFMLPSCLPFHIAFFSLCLFVLCSLSLSSIPYFLSHLLLVFLLLFSSPPYFLFIHFHNLLRLQFSRSSFFILSFSFICFSFILLCVLLPCPLRQLRLITPFSSFPYFLFHLFSAVSKRERK